MGGAWSTHEEEECVQGLMGKTGGMRQLENPRCKAGLIWFRVKTKWRGTCTHGKEPWGSVKYWQMPDQLRNNQPLRNETAPWSWSKYTIPVSRFVQGRTNDTPCHQPASYIHFAGVVSCYSTTRGFSGPHMWQLCLLLPRRQNVVTSTHCRNASVLPLNQQHCLLSRKQNLLNMHMYIDGLACSE